MTNENSAHIMTVTTDVRTKKETKTAMKVLQKNVKNIKRDISKGKSK